MAFKAKVALEEEREKTLSQLATEYGLNPNQIGQGRKNFKKAHDSVFEQIEPKAKERHELEDEFYSQIGKLKMDLEWLKKSRLEKVMRKIMEPDYTEIPIHWQCELLGL